MLEICGVAKSFSKKVLGGVSFSVETGEFVALVGKSGVGKSTLFNIITGLLTPDFGKIVLDGREITGRSGQVGYMLQKDLLLPYYDLGKNVALSLIIRGVPSFEARRRAVAYFADFGLKGCEGAFPAELSAGMRQRAALLRTVLFGAKTILLDEPFCALDALTKTRCYGWYSSVAKKLSLTTILITHDIDEALRLAARIVVLGENCLAGGGAVVRKVFCVPKEITDEGDGMVKTSLAQKKKIRDEVLSLLA